MPAVRTFLVRLLRSTLRGFCFQVPLKTRGNPVRVPVLRGVGLELCRAIIQKNDSWKSFLLQRLVHLREGIFVDVGANLGQSLIAFQSVERHKEYLGFEPIAECVDYINTLVRANHYDNCTVLACGLSDTEGVLKLYRDRGSTTDSGSTVREDLRPGRRFNVIHVPVVVFDHIKNGLVANPIGFVKVDVEGAELEVLSGMRQTLLSDRPLVLCEVLFTDPSADLSTARARNDRLMNLLRECNYTAWQLIKSADCSRVSEMKQIEALESAYWSQANAELCDYLYIPQEHQQAALEALKT